MKENTRILTIHKKRFELSAKLSSVKILWLAFLPLFKISLRTNVRLSLPVTFSLQRIPLSTNSYSGTSNIKAKYFIKNGKVLLFLAKFYARCTRQTVY